MATDNPILHALVDLCQAVDKQGVVGPATSEYQRAMQVLRDAVKVGGSDGPNCRDAALEEAATIADREWIGENSLIASRCAGTIARSIRALKSSRGATESQE